MDRTELTPRFKVENQFKRCKHCGSDMGMLGRSTRFYCSHKDQFDKDGIGKWDTSSTEPCSEWDWKYCQYNRFKKETISR